MISLSKLLKSVNVVDLRGPTDISIEGIKSDSRKVQKNDIFVAIKGTSTDGHDYVNDALRKGAICIVYENPEVLRCVPNNQATFVRVSNTSKALSLLACAFFDFPAEKLNLIGITGTNGKTSTAVLIENILKAGGISTGRIGTLGYCWNKQAIDAPLTTPDPLMLQKIMNEMLRDGVKSVVMEVSSHALSQNRIDGCCFNAAIFTNLTQDHLDYHQTIENYFQAKTLLFLNYMNSDGVVVINLDDPYGVRLLDLIKNEGNAKSNVITYGIHNREADVIALDIKGSHKGTRFRTRISSRKLTMDIETPLLGMLNVYNILAAISAVIGLRIMDISSIVEGVRNTECVRGRLERVESGSDFSVVIDYAHTPDALEKVLKCIREWTKGRLITVFGCGGDRDRTKRPLMADAASRYSDVLIVTSDNPRSEKPDRIIQDIVQGVPHGWTRVQANLLNSATRVYTEIIDRRSAIECALSIAESGDTVVIAGKGHETYQIIGSQKIPFDDRQVVADFFEKNHYARSK